MKVITTGIIEIPDGDRSASRVMPHKVVKIEELKTWIEERLPCSDSEAAVTIRELLKEVS
jgi:hypothetical protein